MPQTKTHHVVMLPTEGFKYGYSTLKGDLVITNGHLGIYERPSSFPQFIQVKQHLYFTSKYEIKTNGYYYDTIDNCVRTVPDDTEAIRLLNEAKAPSVVASTDPSLGLPIIPESFLRQYVDSNGIITDVELEIQEWNTTYDSDISKKHLFKNRWNYVRSELPEYPFNDAKLHFYERLKLTDNNEVIIV